MTSSIWWPIDISNDKHPAWAWVAIDFLARRFAAVNWPAEAVAWAFGLQALALTVAAVAARPARATPAEAVRRWVLAPLAAPPAGSRQRGRVICTCLDVAEQEITERIAQGAGLSALQETLKCGTQCGSCVPELKRLFALGGQAGSLTAARS